MFEPLSYAISDYIYKAQYSVPKSRMDEYLIILSELSKLRKVGDIDIYICCPNRVFSLTSYGP